MKQQYQNIDTISLRWHISTSAKVGPDFETTTENSFQYWAEGTNYRIRTVYDSNKPSEKSHDVAYNGKRFQLFEGRVSRVVISTKDKEQIATAPPNPFFFPLMFLSKNDDNNVACTLKFAHVVNEALWERKLTDAKIVTIPNQLPDETIIRVAGGILDKREFVFHVHFGKHPDYLPSKIDRVDMDGNNITSAQIEYERVDQDGTETYWPKSVSYFGQFADGKASVEFRADREECQIDGELPSDVFTLDYGRAETVWDDDLGSFLRTKSGFRPPPPEFSLEPEQATTNSNLEPGSSAHITNGRQDAEHAEVEANASTDKEMRQTGDHNSTSKPSCLQYVLISFAAIAVVGVVLTFLCKRTKFRMQT
jgi:hypothetical protein